MDCENCNRLTAELAETSREATDTREQLEGFVNGKLWHTGERCREENARLVAEVKRKDEALKAIADPQCGCRPICQCLEPESLRIFRESARERAEEALSPATPGERKPDWECAKHNTFGPSYLKCAGCLAPAGEAVKEAHPADHNRCTHGVWIADECYLCKNQAMEPALPSWLIEDASVMLNTLKSLEVHCPCGARPHDDGGWPHATGCQIAAAIGTRLARLVAREK